MLQTPNTLSKFIADKEGDSWYLCFMSFQKFMMCNDRSPVKIDEANLFNKGFWERYNDVMMRSQVWFTQASYCFVLSVVVMKHA